VHCKLTGSRVNVLTRESLKFGLESYGNVSKGEG
jgi:hypothetical protein